MRINDGFVMRRIYGQCLLFPVCANEAGDELIFLNDVGADIWEHAVRGESEEDIVAAILQSYELEPGSVEEESIRIFISMLCERKLLYR